MRWPRRLLLRRKITSVIMINTFVALCVAGMAFAEYGLYRFKQLRVQDMNTLASILGTNSTASLVFKDPKSATDILQALAAKPRMLAACIYDRKGNPFALYHRRNFAEGNFPPPVENEMSRITSDRVLTFQKIIFEGERIGTVFMEGDTVEYRQLIESYFLFFGLIVTGVSLAAYGAAIRLQRSISGPILELAWTTKIVTKTRDYSIRAGKQSEDEVGVLIDGINEMLAQIQVRDAELSGAGKELEHRVEERTLELKQEVSDRQHVQEALLESEERIRLLLDSTAEAVYGIDRQGRCTFCNQSTLRMLGYQKPGDLLGKNMHQVMHHTRADGTSYPAAECRIHAAMSSGEGTHTDDDVLWRADGTSFPAEYWATPIRKGRDVVGIVVAFVDITERKRSQITIWEAKEAAEAANRAKSEFLANMSHEIRTPMNGIIGMTDLALDTELSGEQREYLGLVKSSAESLLRVINDILDFSKIEAGKFELEEIGFEIRDLMIDTVKSLALRAHEKNLELNVRVSDKVPSMVMGDPTRLRQLIVNLVGNAIKFTDAGYITVDTQLERETEDEIQLHIRVSDTGIGIPDEKQKFIFEPFSQADGSTTRRFGGTGLGLTITRRIVGLLGGHIWVESEVGRGSVFHFTTTLKRAKVRLELSEAAAQKSLQGLPVLVVDDSPANGRILSEMLTNWHMNPTLAASGEEGLKVLQAAHNAGRQFPVVLLDAQMPGMGGFALAEMMQSNPALAGSVIMMLTADRNLADAARCSELGVAAVLTKPVGQSELLDVLLSVCERQLLKEQVVDSFQSTSEKSDWRRLNILLAEDNLVNQKLAVRLLEKKGQNMALAITGKAVLASLNDPDSPAFDLILMDIQMPEMDGMEVTAMIRDAEKISGKHIPIIAMTAHAMSGDRERCLAGGMDGYISKPIRAHDLYAEIERCLTSMHLEVRDVKPLAEPVERIDQAVLLERVEGDYVLFVALIRLFLADAPRMLETMRNAWERGDRKTLERAAHAMKGAAASLSAKTTAEAAAQLERSARAGDADQTRESLVRLEAAVHRLVPALLDLCRGVSI